MTILCDGGERYTHSDYSPEWYARQSIDIAATDAAIMAAART